MSKIEHYKEVLQSTSDGMAYLKGESGLPGPRGNLELAQAFADLADRDRIAECLAYTPEVAPTNTPGEFVAFCGVVGLGKLAAGGDHSLLAQIRTYACDPRWRLREAVAMALQRLGDVDMRALLDEMEVWASGSPLEQRAAAAALAEPRLLHEPAAARQTLLLLDRITASLHPDAGVRDEAEQVLCQGLSYCWSVAVAALPDEGKPLMEKWMLHGDRRIRRIMKENLSKKRLSHMDAGWVASWIEKLA